MSKLSIYFEEIVCLTCQTIFVARCVEKRKYCRRICAYRSPLRSAAISKGRKGRANPAVAAYMREHNPMKNSATIAKMVAVKTANGTLRRWTGERGGNGKLTAQQEKLYKELGAGWVCELSIATGLRSPYPYNYKVDIGHTRCKIAVEIDGAGHLSKQTKMKDAKKTEVLNLLGWKVLRFANEEIDRTLMDVLDEIATFIV